MSGRVGPPSCLRVRIRQRAIFTTKAQRGAGRNQRDKGFRRVPFAHLSVSDQLAQRRKARDPGSVNTSRINGRLALAAFLAVICFVLVIGHNSAFCGMAIEYQFPNNRYLFVYVLSVFFILHCDIVRAFIFHPLCHLTY